MPLEAERAALLTLLARQSFRLGHFTLASGTTSDYYIDCRTTTLDAEGGRLCGILLHALVQQLAPQCQAVGGLTMGADPLVSNIATVSAFHRLVHPKSPLIHGFLVRKAAKDHGTARQIEGFLHEGAIITIVDDVCTTGASTLTALEAAHAAGMHVAAILCLVDREQGGRQAIEAAAPNIPFRALFTAEDIRAEKLRQLPL